MADEEKATVWPDGFDPIKAGAICLDDLADSSDEEVK
jgi:hypothetical protein